MGKVDCNGGLLMVVLNRLKYCGKYKGKLSDVRPSYVYRDQAKKLGFVWFSSSESGLLKGLRGIQIKKFFLPSQVAQDAPSAFPQLFSPRQTCRAWARFEYI